MGSVSNFIFPVLVIGTDRTLNVRSLPLHCSYEVIQSSLTCPFWSFFAVLNSDIYPSRNDFTVVNFHTLFDKSIGSCDVCSVSSRFPTWCKLFFVPVTPTSFPTPTLYCLGAFRCIHSTPRLPRQVLIVS